MASVAILARSLDSSLLEWAECLEQQKNEVRLLTSKDQKSHADSRLPMQFYFHRWSAFEGLRLIPNLMNSFPDIFQFVLQNETQTSMAELTLASFAKSVGRSVTLKISNQFVFSPNFQSRSLLKMANGISFESREMLMRFKRSSWVKDNQLLDVILPLLPRQSRAEISGLSEDFLDQLQPFVFFPGPAQKQNLQTTREALQGTPFQSVFLGPRTQKTSFNYSTFEKSNEAEKILLLKKSHGLCLCLHDFDLIELMDWGEKARLLGKPIWVSARQAEFIPGLCRPHQNGRLVEGGALALRTAFENPPRLLDSGQALMSLDQRMNSWNRFYAKVLHPRT